MVVISILTGIVTIMYQHTLARAKANVLRHNVNVIREAIHDYRNDHGTYPEN